MYPCYFPKFPCATTNECTDQTTNQKQKNWRPNLIANGRCLEIF